MEQKLVIGTDEAGYGPNIGPLVITATRWSLPSDVDCRSLWQYFDDVLTDQPKANDQRLFVADSKEVYSPAAGLVDLETGVLSFLAGLGITPVDADELGCALAGAQFRQSIADEPIVPGSEFSLPAEAFPDEVLEFGDALQAAYRQTGVHLTHIQSRVIFPAEFNSMVSAAGSKGQVLSNCTLQLVRKLCKDVPDDRSEPASLTDGSVQVICDKHGGRNRYDEVIADHFDDQFVFRLEESTDLSRYRMGTYEFAFRTRAESYLPVALASMVSKYLREVLMHCLNNFWQRHIPDLKPTKGYPLDARRFRTDISETAVRLGIDEDRFWRCR